MCGIIGTIGKVDAPPILLDGLKRLEYRGYDSAGIATLVDGGIERRRAEGKIANLESLIDVEPLSGTIGIGHTRWATHGSPTEVNAHPHADDRVVLVHNGIIENFQELRQELSDAGHSFQTETDTEAVVHLISSYLAAGKSPAEAVAAALKRLEGAFALAILFAGYDDMMIAARRGSPLAIGYGNGEMYIGSDALALAPLTQQICYLEEGDWACLTRDTVEIRDAGSVLVNRPVKTVDLDLARARNITVTNTPGYADVTVAEHTHSHISILRDNLSVSFGFDDENDEKLIARIVNSGDQSWWIYH